MLNHFSEEWQNEYEEYCKEHALCIGNESAEQFVKYKDELLEQGMETENAWYNHAMAIRKNLNPRQMDIQPEMRDILMRNGMQAHIITNGDGYQLAVQNTASTSDL